MTNSIIPYSFTPGTKAKAQEVNANFNALAEKIESNDSTTIHTNSNTTIEGELTFSSPIYSNQKHHDTKGNLTITNIADGEFCDAILGINDTGKNCASLKITNGNGYNEIALKSYNEDGSSTSAITLTNSNGTSYATAPTYSSNYADSTDKIVTTSFLSNRWVTTKATTSSTASKNRPAVVVTNYVNGTSWYRIWSDGWKEQGGLTSARSANDNLTITLLKTFANTNYTIIASNFGYFGTNESGSIHTKTTKNFQVYAWAGRQTSWYACGY